MRVCLLKAFALSILVPVATAHSLVGNEIDVLNYQANLRGADIGELVVRYRVTFKLLLFLSTNSCAKLILINEGYCC
jgi:hypothetical protein